MRCLPCVLALGVLLTACEIVAPSGSVGAAGASSSSSGSGGAGGAEEHPCDGKNSCDTCHSCALNVQCAALATACSNSSGCVGIDQCFAICGTDAECRAQCYLQSPDGEATYRALLACVFCDACPDDCAGYTVCK